MKYRWKKIADTLFLAMIFHLSACSQPDSLKGKELYSSNFIIDNVKRDFTYYLPANYGKKDLYPLAIFLHGMGSNGKVIIKSYDDLIHGKADLSDCIVIYPDAFSGHWNDKMGGSYPATDTINDVGFISILIDYFIQVYHCDAKRVYIAGFSNGGEMAYRIGCDIPFKITAIAPFISLMGTDAAQKSVDQEPLPVMMTYGTADSIVREDGGVVKTSLSDQPLAMLLSADSTIRYWKMRNHSTQAVDSIQLPDSCPEDNSTVVKYTYRGTADIVVFKIINGGHAIPAKNKTPVKGENCDFDAIDEALNFFLSHRKK